MLVFEYQWRNSFRSRKSSRHDRNRKLLQDILVPGTTTALIRLGLVERKLFAQG